MSGGIQRSAPGRGTRNFKNSFYVKIQQYFCCSKFLWECDRFHGERLLKGRPWILSIPRDKPWACPEIKLLINPIEMQTNFSQEENHHVMWDTTGRIDLTTVKLPRLAVVPYVVMDWLSKKGRNT